MTRLAGRQGKVVVRMMITLLFTMMVVGVVQYVAVDRALTHRALIQLAAGQEADAKVIRGLYETSATQDRLGPVKELLNHVASRPGVMRVALISEDATVAAVGRQGHGDPAAAAESGMPHAMPAMSAMPAMPHAMPAMPAKPAASAHPVSTDSHHQAPAIAGAGPGRIVGERVEDSAARTVQQVAGSLSSDTHLTEDGLAAVVTVPVTMGSSTYAFEVVRSAADLRQQLSDLRWTLLGTLGLGLPLGLAVFYLVGARRYSTRLNRALKDSATDGLTGLRNHREFHEELHRRVELARRHGRSLSLALIDLDGFKTVNDTLGHRAGDRVLAKMGLLLSDGRPEDLPFRTGGDEFALLLPETDAQGAQTVAERIREQVEAHIDGVTTSIGVADFTLHVPDADALVEAADTALYAAKRQGRNRVVRSSPAQDAPAGSSPATTS